MDGFRRLGDLRANSPPELKCFVHGYPIQFRPTVCHDESYRAFAHKFSDKILIDVPETLGG
jgi:hypothetical protein